MNKGIILLGIIFIQTLAYAEAGVSGISDKGLFALGAALAIGLAAIGGCLGQGKVGSSAMEGLARNPQAQKNMFTSMILGLVFIESIVIFSLVISILMVGQL